MCLTGRDCSSPRCPTGALDQEADIICYRCGAANPRSATVCAACRAPLTASRARAPERRSGHGCLAAFLVLVGVLILLPSAAYAGWLFVARPNLEGQAARNISEGVNQVVGTVVASQQLQGVPAGQYTTTMTDVNNYLASNRDALRPLDQVTITSMQNGRVTANVSAMGIQSTVSTNVTASGGGVQLSGTSIDGPLGLLMAGSDIDSIATDQVNQAIAQQGLQIDSVQVDNDVLVVKLR